MYVIVAFVPGIKGLLVGLTRLVLCCCLCLKRSCSDEGRAGLRAVVVGTAVVVTSGGGV